MTSRDDPSGALLVRVGFELTYDVPYVAPLLFLVEPSDGPLQRVMSSRRLLPPDLPLDRFSTYRDAFGNLVWRVLAPTGSFRIGHDLVVRVPTAKDPVLPHLDKPSIEHIPDDAFVYTLPSRYCPSDLFMTMAWDLFGDLRSGWEQVQAICDHLHLRVRYGVGSTASSDALQTYEARVGVCRDFTHMAISFCRALNIPARYVGGYLPDLYIEPNDAPMDFHAWFEAYLGGAWRTFDARHNIPRAGRVKIGVGRDATDVAFSTSYGATRLQSMRVWADEYHDASEQST
ncbi:transglutaminase-like domain-containing protein [Deinococcus yavapaiensis]|uniref:Transglutaminase-like putative cysteine protease n=1 Tax=Deinococcus yavapaiensis KR-236 TaxID=694435 RepID=A0A318SMV9_9DEIO|nr:transglutaminase family protein [Deinococcus yavapaiensis]PYE53891.1 transglutaminase-like putative cysteine protease [Deinococcus yavapaiensis KR-236]